jgi:hypothetical protein
VSVYLLYRWGDVLLPAAYSARQIVKETEVEESDEREER